MAKTAFPALFVVILFAATAFAQVPRQQPPPQPTGTFDIRGRLVFTNTKPPEDRIEVHLERSMQRIQTTFTDSMGNFEFRSLNPGDYYVQVRLPDYEDVHVPVNVLSLQRTTSIVIQMNPLFTIVRKRNPGFEGDDPDVIDVKMIGKTYPKNAVKAYEKSIDENKKGRTDLAIKQLEEAVRIAPDFYHAQNNLGVAYLKVNRFADAEKAYKAARQINPSATQPQLNLGILYITEADARKQEGKAVFGKLLDDAMDSLDAVIKLKPRSAVAHFYLGTAYYKSDFFEEAEESFKKAREYDPAMSNVCLMLVNLYVKQRRLNDALKQIEAFLKDFPKAEERASMEDLRAKISKSLSPNRQ
jgi:Flp pilus assembly protein TadD